MSQGFGAFQPAAHRFRKGTDAAAEFGGGTLYLLRMAAAFA
jgi:hypothetical protein